MDTAFIRDQESDKIVGIAERYNRAAKTDLDAVHVLMGAQNHDIAVKSHTIAERHADQAAEREAIKKHNAAVLDGSEPTPTEIMRRIRDDDSDDPTPEDFAAATSHARGQQEDQTELSAEEIFGALSS